MGRKKKEYTIYNNFVRVKKCRISYSCLLDHYKKGYITTFTYERLIKQYYTNIIDIGGGYYLFKDSPSAI